LPGRAIPSPPYDPFIFNTYSSNLYGKNIAKGAEIHLPGKTPTSRADISLFSIQADATSISGGVYVNSYKNANGLPWALDIPALWDYPWETENVILAYPNIQYWASSGGKTNADWFLVPTNAVATFRNGR
jgi:LruC domain-containing protein